MGGGVCRYQPKLYQVKQNKRSAGRGVICKRQGVDAMRGRARGDVDCGAKPKTHKGDQQGRRLHGNRRREESPACSWRPAPHGRTHTDLHPKHTYTHTALTPLPPKGPDLTTSASSPALHNPPSLTHLCERVLDLLHRHCAHIAGVRQGPAARRRRSGSGGRRGAAVGVGVGVYKRREEGREAGAVWLGS